MACRWKRWIAVVLLTFSATATAASACAVICEAVHMHVAAAFNPCHDEESTSDDNGTQSELCAFAATPALSHEAPGIGSPDAVYVPPLTAAGAKGLDPAPPLTPPPT